jgi:deoxyribodipyrimidine photo-lyase
MNRFTPPVIYWLRRDFRIHDNRALEAAVRTGNPILPIFIYDENRPSTCRIGSASKWWLHRSLEEFSSELTCQLCYHKGDTDEVLGAVVRETGAKHIFWNKIYEPEYLAGDKKTEQALREIGVATNQYPGSYLIPPGVVLKEDGTPYRVFTAFYKKAYASRVIDFEETLTNTDEANWFSCDNGLSLSELGIMPGGSWPNQFSSHWQPGESGARLQLETFISEGLSNYKKGRDFPALNHVSRLSPHLHFGEITAAHVWNSTRLAIALEQVDADASHFLRELVWREFSGSLLYHYPDLPEANLNRKFDTFAWTKEEFALSQWQKGQTGYPIVDAGMRQLWETGYMHNRVRMIVASFLVKNLRIHWHHGQRWFWDTLVDADLANNSASWQWVAGCGADAAPFFRIFNPVNQGEKFDADGNYVRRYVPELSALPNKYLHSPWQMPQLLLESLGIRLGEDYPKPIVDLKTSRQVALEQFKRI